MRVGRLKFNPENDRYGIWWDNDWFHPGLHCGECLEVMLEGHWVQTRVEMAEGFYLVCTPYHGTTARFLPAIRAEGIQRMNRQYVHLSPDYQTAVAVGRRHGSPVVVLRIEAGAMAQNGIAFFRSENGVWLCEYVPPECFCVVEGG